MSPIKQLLLFFVRLVLLYAILIAPWPGVREAYGAVFRSVAGVAFRSFGSDGRVEFKPAPAAGSEIDTRILLLNRSAPGVVTTITGSSTLWGYFPTAFVVALVLASPVPWRRRFKALGWGLLLITLLVGLRLLLVIATVYNGGEPPALYNLSPFWGGVLSDVKVNLVDAPASHFVIPVFVWILVAIRRQDVERVAGRRLQGGGSSKPSDGSTASASKRRHGTDVR